MTRTLAAVQQTPWDCKWSRLGYRLFDMPERLQPEALWVCVRTGQRRGVTEQDCEHCGHWQPQDEAEEAPPT
jgi:hypothetical protein